MAAGERTFWSVRFGSAPEGIEGRRSWRGSARVDVGDIERVLGTRVPTLYSSFASVRGAGALAGTLASPAQLCALNLAERVRDPSGPAGKGFLLLDQDGDFLLLRAEDEYCWHWSHETREVESTEIRADELLQHLASVAIPLIEGEDTAVLTRALCWTQSILHPIRKDELIALARELPWLDSFDRIQTVNPFTGEALYFDVCGARVATEDGEDVLLKLIDGGLRIEFTPHPLPPRVAEVAARLGCHVFPPEALPERQL